MDIICPNCGEPWDMDELHYNDKDLTHKQASRLFFEQGCGAVFDVRCERADRSLMALGAFGLDGATASEALYDLLGDDTDGIAAMLEDGGW